jgi:DNA-binding NarL/FixJ family response regulator
MPVIVLTSSSEIDDINAAYERGASSYLVKPVSNSALVDLLKLLESYWLITNRSPDLAAD